MKQFRSASVAVAGLLALALSACSGTTPEPSESPSPTSAAPTSSAPATPTPKPATSTSPAENLEPPEMPELATEFSVAGFEAFVEYWFETRNYAMATGDVEPMMEVSGEQCEYCLKHDQGIRQYFKEGGWILGAEVIPSSFLTNLDEFEGGVYQALFDLEQMPGTVFTGDSEINEAQKFTPATYDYEMLAVYDDVDGWKAREIDRVDPANG